MTAKELKSGNSYIFKSGFCNPIKGKVTDITETTIRIKWETGFEERFTWYDFQKYAILEELPFNLTTFFRQL